MPIVLNEQPEAQQEVRYEKNEILEIFFTQISKGFNELKHIVEATMTNFHVFEIFQQIAKVLQDHPFMALGVSGIIISFCLPFLMFFVFAVTTGVMTFMGFVFLEGTLLSIACVILFGFLVCAFFVLLFFGAVFLTGYFGFIQVYDLFYKKAGLGRF